MSRKITWIKIQITYNSQLMRKQIHQKLGKPMNQNTTTLKKNLNPTRKLRKIVNNWMLIHHFEIFLQLWGIRQVHFLWRKEGPWLRMKTLSFNKYSWETKSNKNTFPLRPKKTILMKSTHMRKLIMKSRKSLKIKKQAGMNWKSVLISN